MPILAMEYGDTPRPEVDEEDTNLKLFKVELPELLQGDDPDKVFQKLRNDHPAYISPAIISMEQVKRLIKMLYEEAGKVGQPEKQPHPSNNNSSPEEINNSERNLKKNEPPLANPSSTGSSQGKHSSEQQKNAALAGGGTDSESEIGDEDIDIPLDNESEEEHYQETKQRQERRTSAFDDDGFSDEDESPVAPPFQKNMNPLQKTSAAAESFEGDGADEDTPKASVLKKTDPNLEHFDEFSDEDEGYHPEQNLKVSSDKPAPLTQAPQAKSLAQVQGDNDFDDEDSEIEKDDIQPPLGKNETHKVQHANEFDDEDSEEDFKDNIQPTLGKNQTQPAHSANEFDDEDSEEEKAGTQRPLGQNDANAGGHLGGLPSLSSGRAGLLGGLRGLGRQERMLGDAGLSDQEDSFDGRGSARSHSGQKTQPNEAEKDLSKPLPTGQQASDEHQGVPPAAGPPQLGSTNADQEEEASYMSEEISEEEENVEDGSDEDDDFLSRAKKEAQQQKIQKEEEDKSNRKKTGVGTSGQNFDDEFEEDNYEDTFSKTENRIDNQENEEEEEAAHNIPGPSNRLGLGSLGKAPPLTSLGRPSMLGDLPGLSSKGSGLAPLKGMGSPGNDQFSKADALGMSQSAMSFDMAQSPHQGGQSSFEQAGEDSFLSKEEDQEFSPDKEIKTNTADLGFGGSTNWMRSGKDDDQSENGSASRSAEISNDQNGSDGSEFEFETNVSDEEDDEF